MKNIKRNVWTLNALTALALVAWGGGMITTITTLNEFEITPSTVFFFGLGVMFFGLGYTWVMISKFKPIPPQDERASAIFDGAPCCYGTCGGTE